MGQRPFHDLTHNQSMAHNNIFEELVSFIFNGVSEDHYFYKFFPYSLAGNATHWFKKLPPWSFTTWNDIKNAFLNKFLYDAAANLEIKMEYILRYMVEGDEQYGYGELSRVDEVDIGDPTSA